SSSASTATSGVQEKVQSATTSLLTTISAWASSLIERAQALLDRFFPPEQRASLLAKLQAFMLANPKLSTFLGMNLALTGIPLFLFALFTLTVALFSLLVGLLLGLLAAVLFIVFAVGVALMFLFPAVFFTTMTACFLFLWGLGGYYILRWANGRNGGDGDAEAPPGEAVGDKLNNLTGGRLTGFMDAARDERAKGDIRGYDDEHNPPAHGEGKKDKPSTQQQANGSARKEEGVQKEGGGAANKATKATGVQHATGAVKGVGTTGGLA
ncbi:hypothetical protein M433DRAFT_37729, partial [Acidomyces richmondensis BFW]